MIEENNTDESPEKIDLAALTTNFAPAFFDPEPGLVVDMSHKLQDDLIQHIRDPSLIVAPAYFP